MTYAETYARLIAKHYDASYAVARDPSGDARFYRELAHEIGGPVLELGCGTGRILLPIASDGIECVGLDSSPEMLEVLRAKRPPQHLQVVEQRMQSFDLGAQRFRLVTCPFRAFSHLLDTRAQLAALSRIRHHLLPGGVFAFDVFDPKPESLARREEPEHLAIRFEQAGSVVRRWDTVRRDPSRQLLRVDFRFEGSTSEHDGTSGVTLRWYHRFELEHLLARAGFDDLTFYRTFDREPWEAGAETIVVARLGAEPRGVGV
jgi:SAM-dependent methyltransferase